MACVEEHIRKSIADLARAAEQTEVIALRKHGPAAVEDALDGSRKARADRLHAAAERFAVASLDDQVGVIALEREVDDPELPTLARGREGAPELAHQRPAPQRRKASPQPPGDEAWEATRELFPLSVADGRTGAGRAAGAATQLSPARRRTQVHGELTASLLHDPEHELAV